MFLAEPKKTLNIKEMQIRKGRCIALLKYQGGISAITQN